MVNFRLKRGDRNIGLINGPSSLTASGQRKEGYIKALQKRRLKFDPSLIVECDLTKEGTAAAADKLLEHKRRPTAIVSFNDYVSAFAVKHALKSGITINKEIEFVSFANSSITTYMEFPPLESVEQFPAIQGQKAIDTLLDIINNGNEPETGIQKSP